MQQWFDYFVQHAAWIVPLAVPLLGALGWLIKRRLEGKSVPTLSQKVSHKLQAIQAGHDIVGQQQKTGDGLSIQAGGNVTINQAPLPVSDVRELVEVFVRAHLPALRAEAQKVAQANVDRFYREFIEQATKSPKLSAEEFAKPDAQASFSAGLRGAAIKGDEADISLVVATLIERLSVADDPLLKQVCEVAVELLPKLSRAQIAFITFVHYVKNVRHKRATDLAQVETMFALVMQHVEPGLQLSRPSQSYLESIGVLSINPVADADIFLQTMKDGYHFFPDSPVPLEQAQCVHLLRAYECYKALLVPTVFLTSAGQAIAALNLRRVLGDGVDLSVWIR